MSDNAFSLLREQLNSHGDTPALWLVDENIGAEQLLYLAVNPAITAITNRYDGYSALKKRGFNALLSDYDLSAFPESSLDVIYYRVSKEKTIVHHVINSAGICLKPAGQLVLAGYKNEGIKSYVDKAKKYLGGNIEKNRGSNSSLLATLAKGELGQRLDDKNYSELITISDGDCEFVSKPGVYGWNKIDKGSNLLIEVFSEYIANSEINQQENLHVADIGCGYGYLSVKASQLLSAKFIATDNNVASVALCKQNFEKHSIEGNVIIDDCGASLDQQVDIVLCNPPFHQGFDTVGDLTLKFLQSSSRLLKQGGVAFFVVNSFIGIEKKAKGLFSEIKSLENNGSFKVLLLKK
jgi:16S rRNA (guanine1207-N2)-methyltransferase